MIHHPSSHTMKKHSILSVALSGILLATCFYLQPAEGFARKVTIRADKVSCILPDSPGNDFCSSFAHLLDSLRQTTRKGDAVTIRLKRGTYNLYPEDAQKQELYVSNHDQDQPKAVGIMLEGWEDLTIDGNGCTFLCHGRMLPVALVNSKNCTLRNFSIDFENPHIAQIEVVANNGDQGIVFRPAPWVRHRFNRQGTWEVYGDTWHHTPCWGIAFEKDSRHIVFNTSDIGFNLQGVHALDDSTLVAPNWQDSRLPASTVVAMRSYFRPTPGIFLAENAGVTLKNVNVHYAEGMGLLAQRCSDITLTRFSVCLRGDSDPRYFTTQADATHFSQCKGTVRVTDGLFEGMMDDAVNVHGIYLKVMERIDDHTLRLAYGHGQAWGFAWGDAGDSIQFIDALRMQHVGTGVISSISPSDKPTEKGCREFVATFKDRVPKEVSGEGKFGLENLTWTPEVLFAKNIVRNNRARGALFSSPRRTVCERNLFDHTSGSAIVLCGDCNGWYESGAVRDLVIRKNRFVNALTSLYQFTNAVISIYPEIPALNQQTEYFHGGPLGCITISDNVFETFDRPLLYAKSIRGLLFKDNKVTENHDYPAFHPNDRPVFFEKVTDCSAPGYITTDVDLRKPY